MSAAVLKPAIRRQAARPMPLIRRAVVTQNARGHWACNGVVAKCSLGGHEGMAHAMATSHDVAALFDAATPAERERLLTVARSGFDSIEELWRRTMHDGAGLQ